ncbi:cell wall metabolism sensor histidine kinase WalK [Paenarthrobacter aurescens]|uniref:histidine kinase n=1 Tax=Paenarthrobacter aurescens TaxID=43663 RepID=A0A4Y3NFQ4_PAEAU|nr:PAS domain-containing sensor histidine kinase [Paenarthrobacter aurescens]MDO6142663.1 PAS domain-containing sensor histidine kinase [Paenarthrobacter aurescens]MDO6146510.1 PAS domain-containing sensor histidine kinase [Paenarthrobacter aurescens]MDO6157755.1 PAS domain-containing sensor histidine kinase [Paenarthrobacter aurescens]MDO6161740.1 PAS domain-containing sensor histidine kinase [Paenarthrobacter aurescens]GEB20532.1 two-component sensor histidine kinase [Paenarthrobacter auresc
MTNPSTWDIGEKKKLLVFKRSFHEHTLRMRVVLSQLPLSVCVCISAILVWLYFPSTLENPLFLIFLLGQALLLALCIIVPWHRLPFATFLIIPVLDMVTIGFAREGAMESITGLSVLVVLPVIWLCASGLYPKLAIAMSFLGPLGIVWVPLFIRGTLSEQDLTRPLLFPILILGIGVSVSVLTLSMVRQQRALEQKDEALKEALSVSTKQERLLNTVMEALPLGVVAVDGDGHDILMNRRQRQTHVLATPADNDDPNESQLLIFDVDRTTPLVADRRPVRRAVLGERFTDQLVWLGSGSDQRAFTASARPMVDDAGKFAGSVVVFSDVTDLVNALAAKDDFVANVSHEFRTPLTSILGYVELILDEPDALDPRARQQLDIVRRNAERLLTLVSDLLAVRSGQIVIQPHTADVAELVRGSVNSAEPRAAKAGIRLSVDLPDALEARVDSSRIAQVLDNLVSNAIKYSPDGGDVEVAAWEEEDFIFCRVSDTGMGMNEEEQAEAFTKFFRAGGVRKSAIPGVGLGLPISKAIVEAHGGTITLESEPGRGTTFTVKMPA